jgi:hypothetical protein
MITGSPLFPGENNLEQWNLIVKVVGTPNEAFSNSLPEGIKSFVENSPKIEPQPWDKIFKDEMFPSAQNMESYRLPRCTGEFIYFSRNKLILESRFVSLGVLVDT